MKIEFDTQKQNDLVEAYNVLNKNRRILVCELIGILSQNDCFNKVLVTDAGEKVSNEIGFSWDNFGFGDKEFAVVCNFGDLANEFVLVKDFIMALNEFCKKHPRAKTMEFALSGGICSKNIYSVGIFENCVSLSCHIAKNRVFELKDLSQDVEI